MPIPMPRRQRALSHAVRIIDLIVYAVVFVGGLYAIATPPDTVVDVLEHYEWLAIVWAILLVGGGLVGFIGRLTRYWLVENPATIAASSGILIYVVILYQYTFTSITAAVATALALVACGFMIRRWLELQIFATEPHRPRTERLLDAMKRRTRNTVSRYE